MVQNLISYQALIHQGIPSTWTLITYLYGFTLVFFNLHCINKLYISCIYNCVCSSLSRLSAIISETISPLMWRALLTTDKHSQLRVPSHLKHGKMRSVCMLGIKERKVIMATCSRCQSQSAKSSQATLHLLGIKQKLSITVPVASARCAE